MASASEKAQLHTEKMNMYHELFPNLINAYRVRVTETTPAELMGTVVAASI